MFFLLQVLYVVADYPNVLNAIYQLKKKNLAGVDTLHQVSRFYMTYNALVNHVQNKSCAFKMQLVKFKGKKEAYM